MAYSHACVGIKLCYSKEGITDFLLPSHVRTSIRHVGLSFFLSTSPKKGVERVISYFSVLPTSLS